MKNIFFLIFLIIFILSGCGKLVDAKGFNDFLTNPPSAEDDDNSDNGSGSGSWIAVGQSEFTMGEAKHPSIAVLNGEPVVAFQDVAYGNKLTVMKYNSSNNSWSALGIAGVSDGEAADIVLKIKGLDIYVAFKDVVNSNSITVMKYSAGNWSVVGNKGFTASSVNSFDMEINNNGEIFVACHTGDLKLYSWNGSTWSLVSSTSSNNCYYMSLEFDSNNIPYVGFTINSSTSRVMRYYNSSWEIVSPDPYPDAYPKTKLVIKDDLPMIVVGNSTTYLLSRIFTGTNWQSLGATSYFLCDLIMNAGGDSYLSSVRAFDAFSTGSRVFIVGGFYSPNGSDYVKPDGTYALIYKNDTWSALGNKICDKSYDYKQSISATDSYVFVAVCAYPNNKLSVYKYAY